MMLVNGSFNLVDAYLLGMFVGSDALAAVTATFPFTIFFVAISTLVANGYASVMARSLGARDFTKARDAYSQAITLSLLVSFSLMALFLGSAQPLTVAVNNGHETLATMSYQYLTIVAMAMPISFMLTVNGDTLRCEGYIRFMSLMSLATVALNALLTYSLIVHFELGVAGSAAGTVSAQALALLGVVIFRRKNKSHLELRVFQFSRQSTYWRDFLSLGAPASLRYVGLALSTAAILYNLQNLPAQEYQLTVSAYGIITRLMTFVFLPLLGLSLAFQSIMGNTFGAGALNRSNDAIKAALVISTLYGLIIQLFVLWQHGNLGAWFVDDIDVIQKVGDILPVWTAALFLMGPLMMVGTVFQSIGDAVRAAIMGIVKTYFFSIPLIFLLPALWNVDYLWFASPGAEILALFVAIIVLLQRSRSGEYSWGLFFNERNIAK
jgi:putative MATE family efflux protein